jgi:hypothetical protein
MANESKKIRITKGHAWYIGKVGYVFCVTEEADNYYIVQHNGTEMTYTVGKENCEVVDESLAPNMVDSPPHYNAGKYEVIDIIEDSLRDIAGGFEAYCLGNVEKYTKRYRHKNGVEDLRKAAWYLNKAIEHIEARS